MSGTTASNTHTNGYLISQLLACVHQYTRYNLYLTSWQYNIIIRPSSWSQQTNKSWLGHLRAHRGRETPYTHCELLTMWLFYFSKVLFISPFIIVYNLHLAAGMKYEIAKARYVTRLAEPASTGYHSYFTFPQYHHRKTLLGLNMPIKNGIDQDMGY